MIPGLKAIVDAIEIEEELPGEMSDEMWAAICGDRSACTESHRIVVRHTKKNIRGRIEKLFAGGS